MFYNNIKLLEMTTVAMCAYPRHKRFITDIIKTFNSINIKDVKDVDDIGNINSIIALGDAILNSDDILPREVITYCATLDFIASIKMAVADILTKPVDEVITYQMLSNLKAYYAIMQDKETLESLTDGISEHKDVLMMGVLSQINNTFAKLRAYNTTLNDALNVVSSNMEDKKFIIVDPTGKSEGVELLAAEMNMRKANSLLTGMFFDHMTGGGFCPTAFYLVCALSGKFKTGTLQNIAEYIINNPVNLDRILVDEGKKPAVLMTECEMTPVQVYNRRCAWYGEKLLSEEEEKLVDPDELEAKLNKLLIDNGSLMPLILRDYVGTRPTTDDIANDIDVLYEKGYQVVLLVSDYVDLHASKDEKMGYKREAHLELKAKCEEMRALGKRYSIPVISGAQLNRGGANAVYEAEAYSKVVDPGYHYSLSMLAKAYDITNVPEMMFFCHLTEINETSSDPDRLAKTSTFYSCIVGKDRDNVAKYVKSDRDILSWQEYQRRTRELKQSPLRDKVKDNDKYHAVAVMDSYKITNDYARSIRMFYPTENSNFTAIDTNRIDELAQAEAAGAFEGIEFE